MKSTLAIRRALTAAGLLVTFLVTATNAFAASPRGGTLTWKITNSTSTSYTVQFTLAEAQRWSYPNTAGSCTGGGTAGSTTACAPVGTTVQLDTFSGGTFTPGDGTTLPIPTGTITTINQAQDIAYSVFIFTHTYAISAGPQTAYFYATNRISTLKLGHDLPEYISTTVSNYQNGAPVSSMPASYSGTYDGNTHALSACVTSPNPDGLTCTNNSTGSVGPGVGAGVVTPVISGSNGSLANYIVTLNNGAYSITQASSAVTVICPASVPHTGSALTPCTAMVTGAGGLSQSLPVTYTANVNAGTANATASYAGDSNHASGMNSTTFIITSGAQTTQLVTTARIVKVSSGYQASITVTNTGAGTAQNVQLTGAALGSTAGAGTPISLGNIPGGTSTTIIVNFPASAGTPGAATVEKFAGTYTGGTFNGSLRVTLPN